MDDPLRIFLGFDQQERMGWEIARHSLLSTTASPLDIQPLSRETLGEIYTRPVAHKQGQRWDVISDAPMSTDHAIARFFVPWICGYQGWALFADGDILCRCDIADLFACADDQYAVLCVQHPPLDAIGEKKDGAIQLAYPRKNWSSVMLFNCRHPANRLLTPEYVNAIPGRHLHAFCWLQAKEIGMLPPGWNYLVGVNPPMPNPAIVHFTLGLPSLPAHAHDPFAEEWLLCRQQIDADVPI